MTRSMSFVIQGDVNTLVQVTENDDGTLTFTMSIIGGGDVGDLRALFFDVNDTVDTSSLQFVSGVDVTDTAVAEGSIDTLGQDANIKGSVSNELGDFDVGIEFGTSGMAQDDILGDGGSTTFTLASTDGALTLEDVELADFGLRYTSVGTDGGERTSSAKIGGKSTGAADNDAFTVTENRLKQHQPPEQRQHLGLYRHCG